MSINPRLRRGAGTGHLLTRITEVRPESVDNARGGAGSGPLPVGGPGGTDRATGADEPEVLEGAGGAPGVPLRLRLTRLLRGAGAESADTPTGATTTPTEVGRWEAGDRDASREADAAGRGTPPGQGLVPGTGPEAVPGPGAALGLGGPGSRWRGRPGVAGVLTMGAGLLVYLALVLPDRLERLTPGNFVRLPVEAIAVAALYLVLPPAARRTRRTIGISLGLGLGLLTVVKCFDMGFRATYDRPFDPLQDPGLADDGLSFLADSAGRPAAIGAAIGIVVATVAVLALLTASVLRLTGRLVAHRVGARRPVAVLAAVWLALAGLGAQLIPHTPLASRNSAAVAIRHVVQVPADLRDERAFDREAAVDRFRDTPGEELLTGLRGKDVILAFVESYGRSAIESPELAGGVDKVLDDGSARLRAAGFASRSGFLTSPTAGGGSWLAQSTLLSGLWIKNQKRYLKFVDSDRFTLNAAFGRADWRTVAVVPGVKKDWPEARVFGFDKIYDSRHLGYEGPRFSWSTMTDQYALAHFERTEHGPADRGPVMAEIPLTSSHMPWTPLPRMIDWEDVGDGSVFEPMATGETKDDIWSDPAKVRSQYRKSVEYSLTALISYLETYGDDDTVLVFLGDHQPIPMVAGQNASHDVPITIVARDPKVMERVSGWGWQDGLNPGPDAPVWPMSDFRDRFLTAFGPQGAR